MLFATSFAIRLDKSAKLKDNYFPIVLQITYKRKVRRKRLGLKSKIDQWDFDNHEFKKGISKRREKNKFLESVELKSEKIIDEHFSNKEFNFKDFFQLFENINSESMTVLQFCKFVVDDFLMKGKASSSNDYKTLYNAILKVSPSDLFFEDFTISWLEDFELYFTSRGTKCYKYMVHLRALYNKAINKRIIDFKNTPFRNQYTNPFGYSFSKLKKSKISKTNPNRIKDLQKEELMKLKCYKPESQKEQEYLDVWWFSFYMFGVNLTDIANLKRSDIKNNRWFYLRSKTGSGLKKGKPILPEAQEIINRQNKNSEYIFPILTNGYDASPLKEVNRIKDYGGYIRKMGKRVSKKIGLQGYFTFYSTRYSSATLALNEGADRNTVSHLLDHENFSTIDNYAGKADDNKVVEAMEILRLK